MLLNYRMSPGKLLGGISGMTVINTCLLRIPQKTYAGPYADFWKGGGRI